MQNAAFLQDTEIEVRHLFGAPKIWSPPPWLFGPGVPVACTGKPSEDRQSAAMSDRLVSGSSQKVNDAITSGSYPEPKLEMEDSSDTTSSSSSEDGRAVQDENEPANKKHQADKLAALAPTYHLAFNWT